MRVLLAEDEPKMSRAIRRGLEREGFAVDCLDDGTEAIRRLGEVTYDAVVLDVMLPGATGLQICRHLRESGRWMPVIMLTARGSVPDRIAGLDAGADDYLVKPFAFGELLARLRALTRRVPSERPTKLSVGDVTVDPAAHRVTRAGRQVRLSAREFAVLEHLMRHPADVVTRSELIDHVWDYNYDGMSNIVDVNIANLRRKIEQPFGRTFIHTVRGVGYTLDPQ